MLETKYFKDMNHNYLIVNCPVTSPGERYRLKMITGNNIPGLLPVSERHINAAAFLYYEVNSLQTLQTMFEQRKVGKAMAIKLLSSLHRVLREIKNYLLCDSGLILKPEYIYLNWEREEVYFVYYPFENEIERNQIKFLLEYLVRVLDHRDEQLTDTIYSLCQLAEQEMFSVEELDRHLLGLTARAEQINYGHSASNQDIEMSVLPEKLPEPAVTETYIPLIQKSAKTPFSNEKKQKLKFLLLTLIAGAGAVFTGFYQHYFLLTARETVLSWILIVVFLVFFLITGVILVLLTAGSVKVKDKTGAELPEQFISEEEYRQIIKPAPPENIGETVFLSEQEEIKENKLYGINKGNKYIIELSGFPFTIGKLAENSDFCLKETSVSRIHARFTQSENTVFMTDLNSTNGTYKNGLRLEPSETVALEAGDEIRLGKLSFCYR